MRVIGALMRASLMTALQYRANFISDSLTGLARTFATAAPLWLVFQHTDAVAGWDIHEASLVMALYLLMEALVGGLIQPNLGMVVEAIRLGSLDLVLLKPADAQLLVSLRSVAPARIWDLLAAFALGGWALSHLPPPAPLDVLVAVAMLASGLASIYAIWLLAICTSFFFVRVDNLQHLLSSVMETGRWPLSVFHGWMRWMLTVVIPVGIITSFPAMAVRGHWDPTLVMLGVGVAAAFVAGSRAAWLQSLASYTSASS